MLPSECFGQSGLADEALVATDTNRYRLVNVAIGRDLDGRTIEFRARRQDVHIEARALNVNKPHNRDRLRKAITVQFATQLIVNLQRRFENGLEVRVRRRGFDVTLGTSKGSTGTSPCRRAW